MANRKNTGGPEDTSGLSSGKGRPAEATVGASGAARSGSHVDLEAEGKDERPIDTELAQDLDTDLPLGRDDVTDECARLAAEAAEWREKGMRAQAEYENVRKRLEQRHADALLRASARVVEELFPIVDDLERAIDHAAAEHPDVAEGLGAVYRKLSDVIAREGCIAIDPIGEHLDPERHNAVQVREDDALPDHTCVEVFQKGYEMHGRVLRPAMVVVTSGGPSREE